MKKTTSDFFREYSQKGVGPVLAYLTKRVKKMKEAHIPKYKELEGLLYNLKREQEKVKVILIENDKYIKELEESIK